MMVARMLVIWSEDNDGCKDVFSK